MGSGGPRSIRRFRSRCIRLSLWLAFLLVMLVIGGAVLFVPAAVDSGIPLWDHGMMFRVRAKSEVSPLL